MGLGLGGLGFGTHCTCWPLCLGAHIRLFDGENASGDIVCDINFARHPYGKINFENDDLCEDNKASSLIIIHAKRGDTFKFYDDPDMREGPVVQITVSNFRNYMNKLHSFQKILADINEPVIIPSIGSLDEYISPEGNGRKKRQAGLIGEILAKILDFMKGANAVTTFSLNGIALGSYTRDNWDTISHKTSSIAGGKNEQIID